MSQDPIWWFEIYYRILFFQDLVTASFFLQLNHSNSAWFSCFSEVFTDGEGNIKTEGEILINTKLANSLQRIADDPSSFYDGSLASDIVADIAEYGTYNNI